jgi:hypothetical protein
MKLEAETGIKGKLQQTQKCVSKTQARAFIWCQVPKRVPGVSVPRIEATLACDTDDGIIIIDVDFTVHDVARPAPFPGFSDPSVLVKPSHFSGFLDLLQHLKMYVSLWWHGTMTS